MLQRVLGLIAIGTVAVLYFTLTSTAPADGPVAVVEPIPHPKSHEPLWQGVGSCASTACHGRTDGGLRQAEYTIWMGHDLHAKAYDVLFDAPAVQIMRNLYGIEAPAAHRTGLCLECHGLNLPEAELGRRYPVEDGVGCESCHGPAEQWRTVHYQPWWRGMSSTDKAKWGMRDTKDLMVRAEVCANCHVGRGERDVNHDLIAAGHPRLNFELGLFSAKMPKHWSEAEEKTRYPDLEARLWVVGQIASAKKALELLADRAEGAAQKQKPWPEFAEYACSACHHSLREPTIPLQRGDAVRAPGSLSWGTWYYAWSPLLAEQAGVREGALTRLRRTMSAANPDPKRAAEEARAAARQLETWLRSMQAPCYDAGKVQQLLNAVVAWDAKQTPTGWDHAAQEYLALAALYHGLKDLDPSRRDPVLRHGLDVMANTLERSPTSLDLPHFRATMQTFRDRLAR